MFVINYPREKNVHSYPAPGQPGERAPSGRKQPSCMLKPALRSEASHPVHRVAFTRQGLRWCPHQWPPAPQGQTCLNRATDREACAKDFLACASECASHGTWAHDTRNLDDLVHRKVTVMHNVLHLLTVAHRLLQRPDNKRRGRGDHRHGCLAVWMVSFTDTFRPFQSFVSLQMSSPNFFWERPSGPILGASADAGATMPPSVRITTSLISSGGPPQPLPIVQVCRG